MNTLCFKLSPPQDVYGPSGLNDGHSRPEGVPHIWRSRPGPGQWLELRFGQVENVRELVLYFDSDLGRRLRNIEMDMDHDAIPTVVRDYTVLALVDGAWVTVETVVGNYQRKNTVKLEELTTEAVRIEFHATNGSDSVGLYEVRVY